MSSKFAGKIGPARELHENDVQAICHCHPLFPAGVMGGQSYSSDNTKPYAEEVINSKVSASSEWHNFTHSLKSRKIFSDTEEMLLAMKPILKFREDFIKYRLGEIKNPTLLIAKNTQLSKQIGKTIERIVNKVVGELLTQGKTEADRGATEYYFGQGKRYNTAKERDDAYDRPRGHTSRLNHERDETQSPQEKGR